MLKPAILYENQIIDCFNEYLYTDEFYYYSGWLGCNEIPDLEPTDGHYQYAIVDEYDDVIGYFAYRINYATRSVYNFGLFSFDKGNPIIGFDVFKKLGELVNNFHKLEWRMIEGNPVKRHYDKFCKRYNGTIHHLRDTSIDKNGNYNGEYIYEIIEDDWR